MNHNEFMKMKYARVISRIIKGSDLANQQDRILLDAITDQRAEFVLRLSHGKIIGRHGNFQFSEPNQGYPAQDLVPDHSLINPETSDFEFCTLLIRSGIDLTFDRSITNDQR